MKKKTICLNMIVKNESHVIRRCLSSVKQLIDTWVIVDTGSTDGTQEIIRAFLKDIPGELHERPWVNFGHNRNEALALARGKADYFLFIDADDRLVFSNDFHLPDLKYDSYYVIQRIKSKENAYSASDHAIVLMVKDLPDFKWVGALHETIQSEEKRSHDLLHGVFNEYMQDGHLSQDHDKGKKQIALLEKTIEENPTDARSVFLLAKTLASDGDFTAAIQNYEKRVAMGGRKDEIFYSLFYIGVLQKKIGLSSDIYMNSFYRAFLHRPTRAEPLFEIAQHFVQCENHFLAYLVAEHAHQIPQPIDLWVESWVYDWGSLLQLCVCSREIGLRKITKKARHELLAKPNLPAHIQEYIKRLPSA